jgi:predicted nucleotide-binding protein
VTKVNASRIATLFSEARPIVACGIVFQHSEIEQIGIFVSAKSADEIILPNGKSITDEQDNDYVVHCFATGKIEGVRAATDISFLPKDKKPTRIVTEPIGKKKKVFIVHGSDDKPALQLQKYLRDKLKLDADMFEDFKEESSSNTIIEQLEYIRNDVGYALVIATPDDVGCLKEEMEKLRNKMLLGKATLEAEGVSKLLEVARTRARQNVVFEHGLFIGALGRDNVCCLLHKGTQGRPSDTDGILYVGFDESVRETFPEITEKLKKTGLVSE